MIMSTPSFGSSDGWSLQGKYNFPPAPSSVTPIQGCPAESCDHIKPSSHGGRGATSGFPPERNLTDARPTGNSLARSMVILLSLYSNFSALLFTSTLLTFSESSKLNSNCFVG